MIFMLRALPFLTLIFSVPYTFLCTLSSGSELPLLSQKSLLQSMLHKTNDTNDIACYDIVGTR
jgi:hypothetical protein